MGGLVWLAKGTRFKLGFFVLQQRCAFFGVFLESGLDLEFIGCSIHK
jgi:hypothetical protein